MAITRPEDYGTVGSGNDDDLINQAMRAAGNGGKVILEGRYALYSSITLPENICLEGTFNPFGVHPWQSPVQVHTLNSTLIVDPAHTIILSAGAQLHNLSIIRSGTTVAEQDTSQFSGIAITGVGVVGDEIDGVSLTNLQILGFYEAIHLDMCPRAIIEFVSGDNINGIKFGTIYDVIRVKNVHFWPFHTTGAGMTGAAHNRNGKALWLSQRNDMGQFEGFFSYGYAVGIHLEAEIGTATFTNCHIDNTDVNSGSSGFVINGSIAHSNFIGCSSYNNENGYVCASANTDNLYFIGCRSVSNATNGWAVLSGSVHLVGCEISESAHAAAVSGDGHIIVNETSFSLNSVHDILSFSGGRVTERDNKFDDTASSGGFGLSVVNVSEPFILPSTGDKFIVAGDGGFGTLMNGWAGREITMVFDGHITVMPGPTMHLNALLAATSGTTLQLIHTGSYWVEVSRSVNQ